MDLEHACTEECGRAAGVDPARGRPLHPQLGPDGGPLGLEVWVDGALHGRVTRPVTILGRGTAADISIDSALVSRRAAVLRVCEHGVTLEDFLAGTSVLVNGLRCHRMRLCDRDRVVLGTSEVRLVERDPSDERPATR